MSMDLEEALVMYAKEALEEELFDIGSGKKCLEMILNAEATGVKTDEQENVNNKKVLASM